MSQTSAGHHGGPGRYEIRLKGHLDSRWAAWFNGLRISGPPPVGRQHPHRMGDVACPQCAQESAQQSIPLVTLWADACRQIATLFGHVIPVQQHLGLRKGRQVVPEEGADPARAIGHDKQGAGTARLDGRPHTWRDLTRWFEQCPVDVENDQFVGHGTLENRLPALT